MKYGNPRKEKDRRPPNETNTDFLPNWRRVFILIDSKYVSVPHRAMKRIITHDDQVALST